MGSGSARAQLHPVHRATRRPRYLINLADDVQKWLAHGTVDREIPMQVSEELRNVAQALEPGAPISPVPEIPLPPRPPGRARSRRSDPELDFDDEIPF